MSCPDLTQSSHCCLFRKRGASEERVIRKRIQSLTKQERKPSSVDLN